MVTHGHVAQTKRTIELLYRTSGIKYDLFVADSGSGDEMHKTLSFLKEENKIHWLRTFNGNIGQNLGTNACLDAIFEGEDYDWVVCWSPDVEPGSRRALKKLCRALNDFKKAGVDVLASPRVKGGIEIVALTGTGDDIGFPYYEAELLKGYVRAVAADFYDGWRLNVYNALAYGEAAEVKERALELEMGSVVIENIVVKHKGSDVGIIEKHIGYGL